MSQTDATAPAEPGGLKKALREITDPFLSLARTPRALWGVYLSYLIEGLVYFGILTLLGKYLPENVGLSDMQAGWVMSFVTGGITFAMLFLGGMSDRLGIRRTLICALAILAGSRVLLGASGWFAGGGFLSPMFIMVIAGLTLIIIGFGMFQPAIYAGVKQFTDEKTAAMGYAMVYGLNNLGAFFSGVISPPIRQAMGINAVFWTYASLTGGICLLLIFILTKSVAQRDTLTVLGERKPKAADVTAPPAQPILTTPFVILVVLVVVLIAAGTGLFLLRPPDAVRLQADRTRADLQSLENAARDGGAGLRTQAALIRQDSLQLVPPKETAYPGGTRVQPLVFALAGQTLRDEADLADELAVVGVPGTTKLTGNRARAADLRRELRRAALGWLTGAYSLTGRVDDAVVRQMYARLRAVGEGPITLPDDVVPDLVQLGSLTPQEMLRRLAVVETAAADRLSALGDDGAVLVAIILRRDALTLPALAEQLHSGLDPAGRAWLVDVLVARSLFLSGPAVELLAPLEVRKDTPTRGELLKARFATLPGAWPSKWSDLGDDLLQGVEIPRQARFLLWLRWGGVLLLGAVLMAILALRRFLKARPDHPFNDTRFVFFIFMLIPVQTLFAHNWLTLPQYINRAFGGSWVGDNFEFFSNLNPLMIFFLTPIVAALTMRVKVYPMMMIGTFVMALPTFLLVGGPNPWSLMAYLLILSIGEAMWQPRFLQWVAQIAPEGKTGVYMGIGQFPWFLTKVLTGLYSGFVLTRYCPMVGPQDTGMLWFIHGCIAMTSCLGLLIFRRWANR